VAKDGNDLLLVVGEGFDQVRIEDWFDDAGGRLHKIEKITFADGEWYASDIDRLLGVDTTGFERSGTGTLAGSQYDDHLSANGYQAELFGDAGNDLLEANVNDGIFDVRFHGGRGNDEMIGSYGGDTYYYERGDGADVIYDDVKSLPNQGVWDFFMAHPNEPSYQDKLLFGDLLTEEVTHERVGNDLVLHTSAAGDQVTIREWYNPNQLARIEYFGFANGSWTAADIG
jgi:Ca2+-binding RTX toxin-like protein